MSGKATGPTFVKPNERLVILADLDLMEFPLEILYVLHHNKSIASISRDFSLQFFANRYFSQKEGKPDFQKLIVSNSNEYFLFFV